MRYALFDENVEAKTPKRGTAGSAAWDLFSAYKIQLPPRQVTLIRTNLVFEIPTGWVGKIYPRSSFSKTPLRLANSVGIIDSDYRGEIMFAYENTGDHYLDMEIGDKVGQILFERVYDFQFDLVDRRELITTARGAGGFGSTGR